MLLVDVLLEDVAEHVRVDLVAVAVLTLVEMPVVFLEEAEELLKGSVGNNDGLAVKLLDLVLLEEAAVQVGDLAEQLVRGGGTLRLLPSKALKEERAEKISVIGIRLAVAALGELVAQIVLVSIQEALLLNEVKEHQPIDHDGGIPALHLLVWNALE